MKYIITLCLLLLPFTHAFAQKESKAFTESFMQDSCTFSSTGRNPYFVLEPGYQLTLAGSDGKESGKLIITVLNETRTIGGVETRIVEEREWTNDELIEVSRNFFSICKQTNTIFYFGEEVDMYKGGKITSHEGAWMATGKNRAGIALPGQPLIGARYYQEVAPGIAMDRAEIVSLSETKSTKAGTFINCLKTEETTPMEPGEREYKMYAPGIGLIQEQHLVLVRYGFQ